MIIDFHTYSIWKKSQKMHDLNIDIMKPDFNQPQGVFDKHPTASGCGVYIYVWEGHKVDAVDPCHRKSFRIYT